MGALIAHEDSGYEERGASGSVRIDLGTSGRGLTLAPSWRSASSAAGWLWSALDATELAPEGSSMWGAGLMPSSATGLLALRAWEW